MSELLKKTLARLGLPAPALLAQPSANVPLLAASATALASVYACAGLNNWLGAPGAVFWSVTTVTAVALTAIAANITFVRRERRSMNRAERSWFSAVAGATIGLLILGTGAAMTLGTLVIHLAAKSDPSIEAQSAKPIVLWTLAAAVTAGPAVGAGAWAATTPAIQEWLAVRFPRLSGRTKRGG